MVFFGAGSGFLANAIGEWIYNSNCIYIYICVSYMDYVVYMDLKGLIGMDFIYFFL